MRSLPIFIAALALPVVVPAAAAQQLRDPTRPPVFIAPKASAGESERQSGLVLQTVLISPERRHVVINGRVLAIGQSISGRKVLAISESEVLLSDSSGARKLRLYPSVDKRIQRAAESGRKPGPAPSAPVSDAVGKEG